jgi:hypothetical protein
MKGLSLGIAVAVAASVAWHDNVPRPPSPERVAVACLYAGERQWTQNKICIYACAGGESRLTINAGRACPPRVESAPFGLPPIKHFTPQYDFAAYG